MNFYKLTYPNYKSDMEHNAKNPVKVLERYNIPVIMCPICKQWGTMDYINCNVSDDKLLEFKFNKDLIVLPVEEWYKKREDWANKLGIPKDDITPGAILGQNDLVITRNRYGDFLFPDFNHVLVKHAVVEALHKINATGVEFRRARTQWSKKVKNPPPDNPPLWELLVHGHAWSIGMEGKPIKTCKICGIKDFPENKKLVLDEKKWNKTDFFKLDYYKSYIFVTERIKNVLEEYKFTNYKCIQLDNETS